MLLCFSLVAVLALATPTLAVAEEAPAAAPAGAGKASGPEISNDAQDGKAAVEGYAHPAAMAGRPLLPDSPLLEEARHRPPKDLWNEMGLIVGEMKLYADEGRYDPLVDLADRWVADMNGVFVQVYARVITPRQVGLKRAMLTCARAGVETRRVVELDSAVWVGATVQMMESCNGLFARFLPPDVTGLPDEFANYVDPPREVPAPEKPGQP